MSGFYGSMMDSVIGRTNNQIAPTPNRFNSQIHEGSRKRTLAEMTKAQNALQNSGSKPRYNKVNFSKEPSSGR